MIPNRLFTKRKCVWLDGYIVGLLHFSHSSFDRKQNLTWFDCENILVNWNKNIE